MCRRYEKYMSNDKRASVGTVGIARLPSLFFIANMEAAGSSLLNPNMVAPLKAETRCFQKPECKIGGDGKKA